MNASAASAANPHLLRRLVKRGGQQRFLVASEVRHRDGRCLLAQGEYLTAETAEGLRDQALHSPLELSLAADNAPSSADLARRAQVLVASDDGLSRLATGIGANTLFETLRSLRWGPATQLLAACTAPDAFDHAAAVSFVCAALAQRAGWDQTETQQAALAGWLHDAGELYLAPGLRRHDHMSAQDWLAYSDHPRLGQFVADQLDRYPAAVGQAVGQHHERLDGSGYPQRLQAHGLSTLGGLLAAAEALVGVVTQVHSHTQTGRARAQVALRLLPGQFASPWIQMVQQALPLNAEDIAAPPDWHHLSQQAQGLSACLHQASDLSAGVVQEENHNSPWCQRAQAACKRLLTAFYASGASHLCQPSEQVQPIDKLTAIELEACLGEMRWQMSALARELGCDLASPVQSSNAKRLLQVLQGRFTGHMQFVTEPATNV
ncbi:MAG: hypothetical protein RIS44_3337 [Pseudomonadota bacterium]|jgi:hypothetical protein